MAGIAFLAALGAALATFVSALRADPGSEVGVAMLWVSLTFVSLWASNPARTHGAAQGMSKACARPAVGPRPMAAIAGGRLSRLCGSAIPRALRPFGQYATASERAPVVRALMLNVAGGGMGPAGQVVGWASHG